MSILDMKFWSLIGLKKKPKARWSKYYSKKEMNLDIPNISIYQFLKNRSLENNYKNNVALEYFGTKITFHEFFLKIDKCARAFRSQGVRRGDVVTILSANIPEAIISFYALNKIGAVANMVHPLSAENEIKEALQRYSTAMLIAMDITYSKIKNILDETEVYKTIIVSARDSMPLLMKVGYEVTQGYKVEKPKRYNKDYMYWDEFIKQGDNYTKDKVAEITKRDTPAVILHSGGTTGTPKGIVLSNGNFNALARQCCAIEKTVAPGNSILSALPIFHGFGLGVCVHMPLYNGMKCLLVPKLNTKKINKELKNIKKGVLPILLITLLIFGLIMLQPDFGTGFIIIVTIIGLLFVGGVNLKFFLYLGLIGLLGITGLIIVAPYRLQRILSYLNPWSDPLGSGFQIIQSLYAIGPGGLFGYGPIMPISKLKPNIFINRGGQIPAPLNSLKN